MGLHFKLPEAELRRIYAERELAASKRDYQRLVDEHVAAIAAYHQTMRDFQALHFEVARSCSEEFGLSVDLYLPSQPTTAES